MGPFAHPLFSAIMADDVPVRQPAPRRPLPTAGIGLATGLNLNPLMDPELNILTREEISAAIKQREAEMVGQRQRTLNAIGTALDAAALATLPFPAAGDVTGTAADIFATARDPSLLNFGLTALGGLPFVPSVGAVKRVLFSGPSQVHDIMKPVLNRMSSRDTMPVFQNPSQKQIAKELKKSGYLRALRDHETGDVYLWPGDEALHEEIIRQLRLSDRTENLGQVTSMDDLAKLEQ